MKNLSNKKLLAEYRKIFLEYESERTFDNYCAATLTRLLAMERKLSERGYVISIQQQNTVSVDKKARR